MITDISKLIHKLETYKYHRSSDSYLISNFKDEYCIGTLAVNSNIQLSKSLYDILKVKTKLINGRYHNQPDRFINQITYKEIVNLHIDSRQLKLSKI